MLDQKNDSVISVCDLTKTYRLFKSPMDRIKHVATFGRGKFYDEYIALKNVSFDVHKGETVGIIGRNGSGKSTLLQLICGILKCTSGSVDVKGRVLALLELGAGFNHEFTGRENVYFQGALTGFTRSEMDRQFAAISEFADIGEFIDQPVRTYSSGMFVRLAFATTIHMEPDVLVLDEVLAVGDTGFQRKCFERIDAIRRRGGVILLVSHSMEQVAHYCDQAILLDHGAVVYAGDTAEAIRKHILLLNRLTTTANLLADARSASIAEQDTLRFSPNYCSSETRWGDRAASIVDASIHQGSLAAPETMKLGVVCEIRFRIVFHREIEKPIFGVAIKSGTGAMFFTSNSQILLGSSNPSRQSAGSTLSISFFFTPDFAAGDYRVSLGVTSEAGNESRTHDRRYDVLLLSLTAADETASMEATTPSCKITINSALVPLSEEPLSPTDRS